MFHVEHSSPDVIVIGGGHAGCEAAHAVHRMGCTVALITMRRADIGKMSCNPAIGGLGKGHLVREVDAMDGLMGRVADRAGIQFRLLNRRKGPAVQGPRAQADRHLYQGAMLREIEAAARIALVEDEVTDLLIEDGRVRGVTLQDNREIRAAAVIVTSGTFLGGVIHIGSDRRSGGRNGDRASTALAARLRSLDLRMGRLKTGTPPRLRSSSIDWSRVSRQDGDDMPVMFSFLHEVPFVRQVACGITHTNETTHRIIRENLNLSAMHSGGIEGPGPRYCPSIEDKVTRFVDKSSHQVFLEPEELDGDLVYPNGISTSLPADVQERYVRTMAGLEKAEIAQPGYAIEYDYVDPRSLDRRLAVRGTEGLFLAGQINGTTGYEEAAAQGLMAGLNAALHVLNRPGFTLSRTESYIGVMIDDLTSRGVTEPYRVFTSRAEFRLVLRADNADARLTPRGLSLGCVGEDREAAFNRRSERIEGLKTALSKCIVTRSIAGEAGFNVPRDGQTRNGLELLSLPDLTVGRLRGVWLDLPNYGTDVDQQVEADAMYAPYLDRQMADMETIRREEGTVLPSDIDYEAVPGLSNEIREKLAFCRPLDMAQAARMEGMTPAALLLILAYLRTDRRRENGSERLRGRV
jgi:tRNA uridine 5-carboxymethylaminomethyl modification enzyme